MRLLFAITVCCFGAVLWIALALARRIRLGQVLIAKPNAKPIHHPAPREFFEAGEFRTPRPLHLDQEIFKQKPRRPLADINVAFERLLPFDSKAVPNEGGAGVEKGSRSPEPISIRRPAVAYATLFGQNVSIAQIESQIGSQSEAIKESVSDSYLPAANGAPAPIDFARRIPPQPVRASGLRRRVDLSQFNKDLGDLTDPYTAPLRGSGTQGPAAIDNRYRFER